MDGTGVPLMHTHEHAEASARPRSVLLWSAGVTAAVLVLELAGAAWSNSLALLSDAGHVFMDLSALLFSLFAITLAARPVSDRRTFGLHRLEVFAAFLNGLLVAVMAVAIAAAALHRLKTLPPVKLGPMISVAVAGLAANLAVAWRLHGFSKRDLNLRGAFLHVAGDALASLAVVVAGVLVAVTGRVVFDPIAGLVVGAVILVNAVRLLVDSVHILLEGVPKDVDLNELVRAVGAVPGVVAVDDAHVWSICSHLCSFSAHVTVDDDRMADPRAVLDAVNALLRDRYRVSHSTLQLRSASWGEASPRSHSTA
jgi:cobalt-zinc-cadmium efflux system protein